LPPLKVTITSFNNLLLSAFPDGLSANKEPQTLRLAIQNVSKQNQF